jgi:hypothetical protein
MKSLTIPVAMLLAGLFMCASANAQTPSNTPAPGSSTAQKQKTGGLPPGTEPPVYGSGGVPRKQKASGLPAGTTPPVYGPGSAAQKQQ